MSLGQPDETGFLKLIEENRPKILRIPAAVELTNRAQTIYNHNFDFRASNAPAKDQWPRVLTLKVYENG